MVAWRTKERNSSKNFAFTWSSSLLNLCERNTSYLATMLNSAWWWQAEKSAVDQCDTRSTYQDNILEATGGWKTQDRIRVNNLSFFPKNTRRTWHFKGMIKMTAGIYILILLNSHNGLFKIKIYMYIFSGRIGMLLKVTELVSDPARIALSALYFWNLFLEDRHVECN